MNSTTLDQDLHREKTQTVNVVIAYEDASAGQRAMRTYEHLVAQFGDEYLCKCSLWNFEAVKSPEFQPAVSHRADIRHWGINE